MPHATAWVTSSCRDLGLVVTSPGERTHDRPWSSAAVYDVRDTDHIDGRVWFKANGIGTRHEPKLLSVLGALVPSLVPEVLAAGTAERSPATLPNPAADPVDDPARRPPLQQHLPGPVRSGPPDRPGGGVANHRLGRPTIGHPFGTMTATLRSIAHHGGCEVDDPRVQRGARCLPRAVHDVRHHVRSWSLCTTSLVPPP